MKNKYRNGEYFHIFNKSIAGYVIFNNAVNNDRFLKILNFYNNKVIINSFSKVLRDGGSVINNQLLSVNEGRLIKFIAYCLMPSHYHILIKIIENNRLSKYINDVENSYVRFFNLKHNRKGPLWQSSFKAVRIKTNEQLLHVSRYIHLNPSTSSLVTDPYDWKYSSLNDYLKPVTFSNVNEISIRSVRDYTDFIRNRVDFQKKLGKIKKLIYE